MVRLTKKYFICILLLGLGAGYCRAGTITPAVTVSTQLGVAPLAVFFDATGTIGSATTIPFHELEYRWDFGDPAGSPVSGTTWATGSRPGVSSRNEATGAVAAHVYETFGTYTVALSVADGANTVAGNYATIVVQDPEVVFAGANTTCVGAASLPVAGAGGCPAGAAVAQQPNFRNIIQAYACTGCRVLLKRGDTFTTTAEAIITNTGPGTLGAYGSGSKPIIYNQADTSSDQVNTLGYNAAGNTDYSWGDWRIMDLSLNGSGSAHSSGTGISSTSAGLKKITMLRLDFAAFETQFGFGDNGPNLDK